MRSLKVSSYNVGNIRPYSPEIMAESKAKLDMLAKADKDRMDLEEAKNNYESYIYFIRNKLVDDEELVEKVTTEEQREALRKSAEDAEEWMFDDGYTADLATTEAKYEELKAPAEKVFFRMAELTARPAAVEALTSKLDKVEALMKKWETEMEHVTEEERAEVLEKVEEVRKWVEEKTGEQEKTAASEDPAFTSEEVPGQTKSIERLVAKLMKKPKPKPPKKNETESEEKKAETEGESAEGETASDEEKSEESSDSTEEGASETTEPADEEEGKKDGDSDEL